MSDDPPKGKHYVYILAYPEDYPNSAKSGTVFYVGKGIGNRINNHEKMAQAGRGPNPHKNNVIRKIWKNGGQVVKKKLAHFETHEEACMLEIALIFLLPNLTNQTSGGDGVRDPSEEVRQKARERELGRVHSEERRRKNREVHLGQIPPNKGIPMSPEAKRKMIASKTGAHVVFTEEHKYNLRTSPKAIAQRQRLREYNIGRKQSPEEIEKRIEKIRGRKRPPSEKTLQHLKKLNESKRGKSRQMSEEWRRNITEANKRRAGIKQSGELVRKRVESMKRNATLEGKPTQL